MQKAVVTCTQEFFCFTKDIKSLHFPMIEAVPPVQTPTQFFYFGPFLSKRVYVTLNISSLVVSSKIFLQNRKYALMDSPSIKLTLDSSWAFLLMSID